MPASVATSISLIVARCAVVPATAIVASNTVDAIRAEVVIAGTFWQIRVMLMGGPPNWGTEHYPNDHVSYERCAR